MSHSGGMVILMGIPILHNSPRTRRVEVVSCLPQTGTTRHHARCKMMYTSHRSKNDETEASQQHKNCNARVLHSRMGLTCGPNRSTLAPQPSAACRLSPILQPCVLVYEAAQVLLLGLDDNRMPVGTRQRGPIDTCHPHDVELKQPAGLLQ